MHEMFVSNILAESTRQDPLFPKKRSDTNACLSPQADIYSQDRFSLHHYKLQLAFRHWHKFWTHCGIQEKYCLDFRVTVLISVLNIQVRLEEWPGSLSTKLSYKLTLNAIPFRHITIFLLKNVWRTWSHHSDYCLPL